MKTKTNFSENFKKGIDNPERVCYTIIVDSKSMNDADLAHLVERDLAKVEVAGSRPVIRSINKTRNKSLSLVFIYGDIAKW